MYRLSTLGLQVFFENIVVSENIYIRFTIENFPCKFFTSNSAEFVSVCNYNGFMNLN